MMKLSKLLPGYLGSMLTLVALDAVWLGALALPLYKSGIGHLMAPEPNLWVALVFYLVYTAGLWVFAVLPQRASEGWRKTLTAGALYGFFTYATYGLTNLATLRDWPLWLVLIDQVWGCFISALAAASGRAVWRRLNG